MEDQFRPQKPSGFATVLQIDLITSFLNSMTLHVTKHKSLHAEPQSMISGMFGTALPRWEHI